MSYKFRNNAFILEKELSEWSIFGAVFTISPCSQNLRDLIRGKPSTLIRIRHTFPVCLCINSAWENAADRRALRDVLFFSKMQYEWMSSLFGNSIGKSPIDGFFKYLRSTSETNKSLFTKVVCSQMCCQKSRLQVKSVKSFILLKNISIADWPHIEATCSAYNRIIILCELPSVLMNLSNLVLYL